ncbi:hypothetical protein J3326_01385 [Leuconostoc mesenteroides]|uniref:hypothetical protein n=1 Tax=Leuconostoc mesenteroides TaxID=1245 RepID=UPI001CC0B199|nr:hypothetical protein [Leuconostoc mesenteroides]MBZ1515838.1 hypothetical protein [Leuconostoc mesenteroides]
MTNKEQYQKVAQKVIHLLSQADVALANSEFDVETSDLIEYEYYVESLKMQGVIRAALESNAEINVENNGDITYRAKEF